jgi:hypothetical protein
MLGRGSACAENLHALQLRPESGFTLNFAKEDVPEQEVAIGGIGMGLEILTNETVGLVNVSLLQDCMSFGEKGVG